MLLLGALPLAMKSSVALASASDWLRLLMAGAPKDLQATAA
jgi:hypothetical protein